MNVAEVVCLFGPEEVHSGAVRVVLDTVECLEQLGHDVGIFSGVRSMRQPADEPVKRHWPGEHTWWSIDITKSLRVDSIENYHNNRATKAFSSFLDKTRPDVVHFHAIQGLGAGLVQYALDQGLPVVVHMHDWWWFCPYLFLTTPDGKMCEFPVTVRSCNCFDNPTFLQKRQEYLRQIIERVNTVVCVSRFHQRTLVNLGIRPTSLSLCENPVAPFDNVQYKQHKSRGRLRMAYLGGPTVHKGFYLLREAVRFLKGRWDLRYYGFELSRRAYWRARILAAGRWPKEIMGPRYLRQDLPNILAKADLVIVPSVMLESFSLVCREALVLGVPVLAARCGGPEEVLAHGKNGWLFCRGDLLDLRDSLRSLLIQPSLVKEAKAYLRDNPFQPCSMDSYGQHINNILTKACNL